MRSRLVLVLMIGMLVLAALPIHVDAQEGDELELNRSLTRRWIMMDADSLDVVDEIIHPDFVGHVGEFRGPEGVKAFVVGNEAMLQDGGLTTELAIIAEGDLVCFIAYVTGTFPEDDGVETPVEEVGITQIGLHRISDEKIVEFWVYSSDLLTLYQMFGAIPVEGEFPATEPWDIAVGENSLTPAEQRAIVEDLIADFFNAQNMDIALQFFAEDAVIHEPPSTSVEPLDLAAFQIWMGDIYTAFPDFRVTEYTLVSEGDLVAAYYNIYAIFENEYMGIAPHRGSVSVDGVNLYRFVDDKIVEAWFAYDTAGLMMQLMAQ